MAKGAATETALGGLHARMTAVFRKVLERYEQRLDALGEVNLEDFESDVLEELFNENSMPNPAMLSAVTKFLKDNQVTFDTEELDKVSALEQRLKDKAERRNVVDIMTLRPVQEA